ncbi:MAG: hypothetical protein DME23_17625 [Verrucomicrobia bacterium]|nr:MAG: hypothetical protein DME23_17625 [Verrucomicrobiota bacterium]
MHGITQSLANEVERVTVGRHSLREAFELGGRLEAVPLAGLHCDHLLHQLIVRRDEEIIALACKGGPQCDRQRQRNRHGPHPQAAFVALDDLRIVFQGAVDPIENGVVFDLQNDDQPRLRNFECLAVGQRDVDLVRFVQGEEGAALTAERAKQFIELLARRRLNDTVQLFESCFRFGESGLVHFFDDGVPNRVKIDVGEGCPNGVRREPVQFVQWPRRASEDRPDASGRAVGVAADHELGLIEALFKRDAADADAVDGFDAAVPDEAGDEVERFVDVGFFSVAKIRQREDSSAPSVDAVGE